MSRRARLTAAAIGIAAAVLVPSPAGAHPLGTPPSLIIRPATDGLAVAWVVAEDDARAVADHLGLGPVQLEAIADDVRFEIYFDQRLTFRSAGRACELDLFPARTVPAGVSFEAVYDCGGPVADLAVHLTLLQDIDERYQTLYQATTPGGIARGVLTVGAPRATIDFGAGESRSVPDEEGEGGGLIGRITASLQGQAGASPFAIALVLAFLVGALHAATPGHGKTLTAAYLVGTGGTTRQALGLGGIVAATHAVSTGAIAAAAIAADRLLLPGELGPYLEIAAGALVLGLAGMIWRARPHRHAHDPGGIGAALGFRRLAGIGFVGGLIPSPDAIAIVLIAFSLERWTAGAALIAAFSLGLAVVVLGVAVLAVKGAPLVRRLGGGRFAARAPLLVAALFVVVGVVLVVGGVAKV